MRRAGHVARRASAVAHLCLVRRRYAHPANRIVMKPLFHSLLLIGILLLSPCGAASAAESEPISFVASYENTRELDLTVGERVSSILRSHKIECLTITGRGARAVTIGVPPKQAAEARLLLAQAIKAENLPLTLFARLGVAVTPDSILSK